MRYLFRKNKIVWVTGALIAVVVIPFGYHCFYQKICKVETVEKAIRSEARVEVSKGVIHAEVVDTFASHAEGLSGRSGLKEKEGMLFVFDRPGRYAFWMKGMLFPIDIIWINEEGYIVHVERSVSPSTYAVTNPPQTFINEPVASYVLEIGSGQAESLGAHLGTKVRITR